MKYILITYFLISGTINISRQESFKKRPIPIHHSGAVKIFHEHRPSRSIPEWRRERCGARAPSSWGQEHRGSYSGGGIRGSTIPIGGLGGPRYAYFDFILFI